MNCADGTQTNVRGREEVVWGRVLVGVGLAVVLDLLVDAAVSRRWGFAADRFAAERVLGPELAGALRVLTVGPPAPRG